MSEPQYGALAPETEPEYVDNASPFDPPPRSPYAPVPGETGNGTLGRLTRFIYWYGMLTLLIAITTVPAWVIALLLAPEFSNFPLFALAMVPVGPALSAALYTVRARYRFEDQGPWRVFWRGYRLNFLSSLKFWVPALVILGILGFTMIFGALVNLTTLHRIVMTVIGAIVLLLTMQALSISSFFNFRFSDTVRLAVSQTFMNPRVALGLVAVAVLAFGIIWFANEFWLVAASGILAALWYQQVRPSLNHIYQNHTAHDS